MSKRKNTIIIICFILVILLGAGAAAYPLIASSGNERQNGANPHEYRVFDLSLCLVILV